MGHSLLSPVVSHAFPPRISSSLRKPDMKGKLPSGICPLPCLKGWTVRPSPEIGWALWLVVQ